MKSSFISTLFFSFLILSFIPYTYAHPQNLQATIKTENSTYTLDLQKTEKKKVIQKEILHPIIISLIVGIPVIVGTFSFYVYKIEK